MEKGKLPIRMISPGRVFRSDEVDATHSPSFHQVEGLVIDKNITFADLKGTLAEFARELFGEETKAKFRPHHFPFTEPSVEMDVSCFKCGGKGCRFCKGTGWIEILGCGMVHPHVLEMCGIDPEGYTGFAFGVGLERIALLKYEIDDMRLLYENDIRFLKQFWLAMRQAEPLEPRGCRSSVTPQEACPCHSGKQQQRNREGVMWLWIQHYHGSKHTFRTWTWLLRSTRMPWLCQAPRWRDMNVWTKTWRRSSWDRS